MQASLSLHGLGDSPIMLKSIIRRICGKRQKAREKRNARNRLKKMIQKDRKEAQRGENGMHAV